MSLSLNPPRGTQDRYPEEFSIRSYIFQKWREVCESFGYEEYLGPLVEHADIWRAKSGEDVGGTELTQITNKEGEISDLAVRPEMTPTVTRMAAKKWNELPKPVRRFSIANFYRNERPQRGRNREFWQLNLDLFGEESLQADLEILQMAVEIMLAFTPPKDSFILNVNNRYLIDAFLLEEVKLTEEGKIQAIRLMDKWDKLPEAKFIEALKELSLTSDDIIKIVSFMKMETVEQVLRSFGALQSNQGVAQLAEIIEQMKLLGYGEYIQFKPSLMRGFDYYDGMVFEVFDLHPDNSRALFGGGRYNGLADIFGVSSFPAVGCAPGDETMKIFLESRGMIDSVQKEISDSKNIRFLPCLDDELLEDSLTLAKQLRAEGLKIEMSMGTKKLGKSLQYADKKGYTGIIILGPEERAEGIYKMKDLKSGKERIEYM